MHDKKFYLDSYDRRIIFELDKNARISLVDISKKIRKSKQFVDYRIKKLEKEKFILGYSTVIDYSRLGYISMRVYFKFHNINPEQQEDLENTLIENQEVWWLVTLEGIWDVGYAIIVKNSLDFYDYWDKLMKKYRQFILKSSVVIYSHIRQYPKSYILGQINEESGTLIGASKEIFKINELDKKLLKILSDNARLSLSELAANTKSSPQVVKNHIKKLEKLWIIQGYRALFNLDLLGYRYYKAYVDLSNTNIMNNLEDFCRSHPNIVNTNRTIGSRDFEIEFQLKSFEEFETIMRQIRSKFPDAIDNYDFVIARKEKKMVYFPGHI